MKRTFLLMLIVSGYCYGQNEFQVYSNGLIYDSSTMKKLGHIVDSLNLKFKTCDLAHPYYSFPQGMAAHVKVPDKEALKLIENNATIDSYLKSYPNTIVKKEVWIVKSRYTDYREKKFIEYAGLPGGHQETHIRVSDVPNKDKISGWIVDDRSKEALYLSKLEAKQLPFDYARLVQYVDCMIDTTAHIYFPKAKESIFQEANESSKATKFIRWAENFPNEPKTPNYNNPKATEVYITKFRTWDSLRMIDLDKRMAASPEWNLILKEAVDQSVETGISDERLEQYASRYLNKQSVLQLMRSRKVVGMCSMDQSPRHHAMNICKLAAETAKWDIFLRSHLDIMNDHFERVSDGSYAWARRNTYLKELEQLDINAIDLLLGTSLRVKNVSDNHYWGSIGRLGRALADTEDKDGLEKRLLAMIQDEKLDAFNRLLTAYLFSNFSYNLNGDEAQRKEANGKKLKEAIQQMPEYIQTVWAKETKK